MGRHRHQERSMSFRHVECAAVYHLYWTAEDRQSSLPCGEFDSREEAWAAQEAALAELLEQCSSEEERAAIDAGQWTVVGEDPQIIVRTETDLARIRAMDHDELAAFDEELGLSEPQESYAETAARLRAAGDEANANLYDALEAQWFRAEYACDRCEKPLTDEEINAGWPAVRHVGSSAGETEYVCSSCYGGDVRCPNGHLLQVVECVLPEADLCPECGPIVRCECGEATGVRCEWVGPQRETIVVHFMPEYLRATRDAAGYSGCYPGNGSLRLRVSQGCAMDLCEEHGDDNVLLPDEW